MNTGNKILGKHIRQFLHKNNVYLGSLTFYSYKAALQSCKTTARERQKSVLHVQICFLLIRRTSVLHVQFVFLLIRSISPEAIFIVVPVQHYTIYFLRCFQPWLNLYIFTVRARLFKRWIALSSDKYQKKQLHYPVDCDTIPLIIYPTFQSFLFSKLELRYRVAGFFGVPIFAIFQ